MAYKHHLEQNNKIVFFLNTDIINSRDDVIAPIYCLKNIRISQTLPPNNFALQALLKKLRGEGQIALLIQETRVK